MKCFFCNGNSFPRSYSESSCWHISDRVEGNSESLLALNFKCFERGDVFFPIRDFSSDLDDTWIKFYLVLNLIKKLMDNGIKL